MLGKQDRFRKRRKRSVTETTMCAREQGEGACLHHMVEHGRVQREHSHGS